MLRSARTSSLIALSRCLVLLAAASGTAEAQLPPSKPTDAVASASPRLPVFFVENRGQWAGEARYAGNTAGYAVDFHDDKVVLTRASEKGSATVELAFVGARAKPEGEDPLRARVSYFVGEGSSWRSNLESCAAVRYRGLWPGVDLRFYEHAGALEYDVILAPGADLAPVEFEVRGAAGLAVESDGGLLLRTELGDLRQAAPRTWEVAEDGAQVRRRCEFEHRGTSRYGFRANERDPRRSLVVDPVLVWGTYFGTTGSEGSPPALAVDAQGCVYLGGRTNGTAPTTVGTLRQTNPGQTTGLIAKFDPRLSGAAQLIWCTYLGGSGFESIQCLALGRNGEVVAGGVTSSSDHPTSANALDASLGSSEAGFISMLSPDGTSLLYGTFIEGSSGNSMIIWDVAIDPSGMIIAAGNTNMQGMPTSPGAFQAAPGGGHDYWFGKLDTLQAGSSQLAWGTYYGGAGNDLMNSIALSSAEPSVLAFCGYTTFGLSFPRTHTTGTPGSTDAVIGQLDMLQVGPAQRRFAHVISYSTIASDEGHSIIEDEQGHLLLLAELGSSVRILRLAEDGSSIVTDRLLFSGSGSGADLMTSSDGTITATGFAVTGSIPVTPDAFQSVGSGNFDSWVMQLDASLSQVLYASYAGGSGVDYLYPGGSHLRENEITIATMTESSDMPLSNAYQSAHQGGTRDYHIIRLELPYGRTGGTAPRDIELLDLDADGDLDVATANEGSDDLSLRTNDGQGALSAELLVALTAADDAPIALARCDLDADGARDDLAVACAASSTLVLVTNPSSASPTRLSLGVAGLRPSCVATGDLDADPRDDLIVGREGLPLSGGAGLSLVRNGGAAVDLAIPSPHPTQVARVALGDLDGDGDLDLAALARGGSDAVLLFAGDGSGALVFAGSLALASSGLASSLALADLDGDGRNDLAAVQPALFPPAQTLRVFRCISTGALSPTLFTLAPDLATSGTLAIDLAVGDVEGDSIPGQLARLEIAHANAGDGTVTLRHGYTGSAFSSSSSPTVGTNPVAAALGDLNGDGCDDLVVANQGSDDVTVVLSTPTPLAQTYGVSCGGPLIAALGSPTLGNTSFAVELTGGRAFSPALFLFSSTPVDLPLPPSACNLYLGAPLSSLLRFTSGSGRAVLPIGIPNWPALRGVDLYFQGAVFRSPGGALDGTLDLSDALRVQVGQ